MEPQSFALTRRNVLRVGGTALAGSAVVGCDAFSTEPTESEDEQAGGPELEQKEAPSLADRVSAGELPPLEERLPAQPRVIEPVERPGVYGGSWNNALAGPSDSGHLARTIEYDYLVCWDPEWTEVQPNIAEEFEVGDNGTVFTFRLRRGMKWSDGEPFTADDIVFAFNDVLYNDVIHPGGAPLRYTNNDGSPATVEKLGDHEVRITFTETQGLFLEELATPSGREPTMFPRHYMEQFHADYNEDVVDLAEQEGFGSWGELFQARSDFRETAEVPTLYAWYLTNAVGDGQRVVAERNPYYWKVDPDGRQLPYLDEVTFEVIDDVETILLKATSGEFDFHTRHFNDLTNKPVVASNREEGNYQLIEMLPSTNNEMVIMFNLTHKDPALREVFNNKDFRVALSHAINREEVIAAVFQRQGWPCQPAPREQSEFYDPEFAEQYLSYDVDLANDLLDQAGLSERDADGFRLGPDGRRISFSIGVPAPSVKATWGPTMELVVEYWREVGIDGQYENLDRSIWTERIVANEHDGAVWMGEGGLQDAVLYGFYYLPYHAGSRYAVEWANWYQSQGETGEEPPEEVRAQLDLFDQLKGTVDEDEQHDLFVEILRIAKEQFYNIGIVQLGEEYGVVTNDFHNVPSTMPFAYLYPTPAPTRPEQYFISSE